MNSSKTRPDASFAAQIVEGASEIMGACDPEGRIVFLNRAGRAWCGLPEAPTADLALGCAQLYSPASARMIKEIALPTAAKEGVWRGESVLCDHAGRECAVEQVIFSQRDEDGTITGFSTIIRDVSAQRSALQALRESEERFSKAFYHSPDPYVIADYDMGGIVDVNESFTRVFGWSRDEAWGKRASELGMWADLAERDRFLEVFRREGAVHEMEQRRRTKAGKSILCEVTAFRASIGGRLHSLYRLHDISAERATELALRESEELFSTVFRESLHPMLITEVDTRTIIEANEQFCAFSGRTREQLIGHGTNEFLLWVDLADRDAIYAEIAGKLSIHDRPVRMRNLAGEIRLGRFSGELIELRGRKCVVSIFEDTTDFLRAEQALRESEERFSKAFLTSPDAMAVAEYPSGHISEVNDAYCRLFEVAREQLLGHSGGELGMWANLQDRERYLELLNRDGSVREMEATKVKRNGERLVCRITAHRLDIGSRKWVVTRILDITAQRRVEQALRESEEKFSKAFRASPDSVAIATADDGRLIDVNEGFTRLHGWTRDEAVGRTVVELGLWDDPAVREDIIAVLRAGKAVRNRPIVTRDRHGGRRQCLYSGELTEIGGRDCVVALIHDITERQRLEEQLRHAQKMQSVGQLAGGVAHDFNNILTVIRAHASLLLEDRRLDPNVLDALREISHSADFAANLTRQLLLFSRKQILRPGPLVLNDVVTRMTRMLQRVIGENIELDLGNAPDLPQINADGGMLEQVLLNLVVNARDAMPRGGRMTITTEARLVDDEYVRRVPQARPGRFVGLRVRDTGEGIAPEILPRIFDPFFTTKEEGKGTGLGLATAYGIVEQHTGWIEVESQRGQGAQFTAWFPALAAPVVPAAHVTAPPFGSRGGETVLVVEDKEAVRAIVQTVLVRFGYKVVTAANGEEALARWEEHRDQVGLLFTDVVMPGSLTGRDLADRLRGARPGLKVIFCSGYDAEIIDPAVLKVPGTRFLAKPFDVSHLAKTVRELLDGG